MSNDISEKDLLNDKIFKKVNGRLKLLGDGNINKAINLSISYASKSAIDKIKKAGGSVKLLSGEKVK